MRNDTDLSRNTVLPLVTTICCLGLLLVATTLVVRPWFVARFDWLDARGVGHADIDVIFRHFSVLGSALLGAMLFIPGASLLRRPVRRVPGVLWYAGFSAVALAAWMLWIALVFHNTYIALFTR